MAEENRWVAKRIVAAKNIAARVRRMAAARRSRRDSIARVRDSRVAVTVLMTMVNSARMLRL